MLPNTDRNTQALTHPPIHQADPGGTIISRPMNSGTFPFLRYSWKQSRPVADSNVKGRESVEKQA